jgi:glycosyltransferase involved in cell wall biosynthesis
MHVLMLNSLTNQSGSGVRFWSIAQELTNLGNSVFFSERTVRGSNKRESTRVTYHGVEDTGVLWLDILRALVFNLWWGYLFRPSHVFSLKPMPNGALPAILLKLMLKCKIILDIDDLDFDYYPGTLKRGLVKLCFSWLPRYFDVITTHNSNLYRYITEVLGLPRERVVYLAQGVEAERFIQSSPEGSFQRKYNICTDDKVIVYNASLGLTSDFEYILPMLIKFLHKYDDSKILVTGDGSRRECFRREVEASGLQRRMIFTGYVSHGDMPGILKLARVGINYMAPTWANQCRASIKIREYLAAGLSVVCNNVGDAELFKDYVTLCSTIEDYPAAIGQALLRQNGDNSRRGQEFVKSTFSWPPLVEDFVEYLEIVVP